MADTDELVIDTSGAGSEAALRQAQPFGSEVLLRLKKPSTFTVEMGGVAVVTVTKESGAVRIELGEDPGERVLLGDSFRSFLNEFLKAKFDAHTHATVSGDLTTPPLPAYAGAQLPEGALSRTTFAG